MQNGLAEGVFQALLVVWWNTTFTYDLGGKDAPWNNVTAGMVAG
jgi:hypothetical protein